MMIMGTQSLHPYPTDQIPPWDDPTDHTHPLFFDEHEMAAYDNIGDYDNAPMDAFTCDHFRMYEFKVRRCARDNSHDWVDCPYAHPGEKARRRDPRKFHYSGDPCPEYRNRTCGKGDTCQFAHGVFECWLHPSRYRTQPCKDGGRCHRRICFFAHTREQLRVAPVSQPGESPSRLSFDSVVGNSSFTSSPACSLPVSLTGQISVNELTFSVRNMQIGNNTRLMSLSPGLTSLPVTPTRDRRRLSVDWFDQWGEGVGSEGRIMERVESGKEIRAKIYAKLSRENSFAG